MPGDAKACQEAPGSSLRSPPRLQRHPVTPRRGPRGKGVKAVDAASAERACRRPLDAGVPGVQPNLAAPTSRTSSAGTAARTVTRPPAFITAWAAHPGYRERAMPPAGTTTPRNGSNCKATANTWPPRGGRLGFGPEPVKPLLCRIRGQRLAGLPPFPGCCIEHGSPPDRRRPAPPGLVQCHGLASVRPSPGTWGHKSRGRAVSGVAGRRLPERGRLARVVHGPGDGLTLA